MNTRLIILLCSIAVIGTGVVLYFSFGSGQPAPEVQNVSTGSGFPVASQNTVPTSNTGTTVPTQRMSLPATDGGTITVENFLNSPDTVADAVNPGYYGLNYSMPTATSSPYLITYIASTHYFNIELLQEPLGQVRALAQQYLEQRLGISASDLCKLNYTISAPSSVSNFYGGVSLGFSSCPDAITLPQ